MTSERRNVIVSGGSRGLGLGIACGLRDAGYRVVAVARSQSAPLTAAMRESGPNAPGTLHFMPGDLADIAAIPDLVTGIRREFGPIYGLVNNAGIGTSGVLATMRDTDIEHLVRLNTVSPMVLSKYAIRAMMAQGMTQGPAAGGRIVNVASIVAFTGYAGLAAYSATKASLLGFTRSLAREVGKLGITVNAVAPGFIDTEMTHSLDERQRAQISRRSALQRMADVSDVANAVDYLISDKARNVTGTVMTVDAGNTA